jgi:hypothetical protein
MRIILLATFLACACQRPAPIVAVGQPVPASKPNNSKQTVLKPRFAVVNGFLIDRITGMRPPAGTVAHGKVAEFFIQDVNGHYAVFLRRGGGGGWARQRQLEEPHSDPVFWPTPLTIAQIGPNSIIWSDGTETPRTGSDAVEDLPIDWVAGPGVPDPTRN